MPSQVKKCKCTHESQDRLHGKNNRVFNSLDKQRPIKYKCTVCGAVTD